MELFNNFGFEPVFFTAQIVNFLILAFLFKKFLYKPVLKILKDREQKISQGLEEAERARQALEEANIQKDEIIKSAAIEAERIIAQTENNAEELRKELLSRSKSDAEKIILEAKEHAIQEMKHVEEEAKDLSLNLSKIILERILGELFTKKEKETIIARNIKKFERL